MFAAFCSDTSFYLRSAIWIKIVFHHPHIINSKVYDFVINSLPNHKILDWSKLKAFADNKINLNEELKLVLERIESIVGKGENARSIFSFFHNVFKTRLIQDCYKWGLCGKEFKNFNFIL